MSRLSFDSNILHANNLPKHTHIRRTRIVLASTQRQFVFVDGLRGKWYERIDSTFMNFIRITANKNIFAIIRHIQTESVIRGIIDWILSNANTNKVYMPRSNRFAHEISKRNRQNIRNLILVAYPALDFGMKREGEEREERAEQSREELSRIWIINENETIFISLTCVVCRARN